MTTFLSIIVYGVPIILAITLHEAAHAFAAFYRGDSTAYYMKRMTLNPIKHIDPLGTIFLPGILLFFSSPFIFGYAKPVPVNFSALKNIRIDSIIVAFAGPFANLLQVFLAAILLKNFEPNALSLFSKMIEQSLYFAIHFNLIIFIFNMLPILPLDGGRILENLLPKKLSTLFQKTESYGMFIIMGLAVILPIIGMQLGKDFNFLSKIIQPTLSFFKLFIYKIFAL